MKSKREIIDEYLFRTKSNLQELFAGSSQVGISYIINELIPRAMREKKKLVWKDIDLQTGRGEYLFKDISWRGEDAVVFFKIKKKKAFILPMNREEIQIKLDKNETLTREEEMFYLTEMLGHSKEEAERILEINDNKEPNIIID